MIAAPAEYCLGFLFSYDFAEVALIRKSKPAWQAGKLNGIGGKVEACELPKDAMVREFAEETGTTIPASEWSRVTTMIFPDCRVYVYTCRARDYTLLSELRSTTDEQVGIYSNPLCRHNIIPNVSWLIKMATTLLSSGERFVPAVVDFSHNKE
jgi:8-oxo-dGTP diphosphatase